MSQPDAMRAAVSAMYYRKIVFGGDPGRAHVLFLAEVLDRYAGRRWVKRTDSVGRVRAETWSVDFGIAPGEKVIHAVAADVARLPEAERDHWARHVVHSDLSEAYLRMLANPGSCYDDGDLRDWEPA
jgi:hypothetical protein